MKRLRSKGGFTLIELLIVIIIIGILAAIAIPMFLSQRDKAKGAAVKEGVHSIQIGVQSYAVSYDDRYPADASSTTLAGEIDVWPRNPWTNAPMASNVTTMGNCNYAPTSTSFTITGYGKSGAIITVP